MRRPLKAPKWLLREQDLSYRPPSCLMRTVCVPIFNEDCEQWVPGCGFSIHARPPLPAALVSRRIGCLLCDASLLIYASNRLTINSGSDELRDCYAISSHPRLVMRGHHPGECSISQRFLR